MEPMMNVPFAGPTPTQLKEPVMGGDVSLSAGKFSYEGFEFPMPRVNQQGFIDGNDMLSLLMAAIVSSDPKAFLKAAMIEVRDANGKTFFPAA